MKLRSTASRVQRKEQDQQYPDADRLLRLTNDQLAAEMTMDGISGDVISTADIPGPEIDRSPVVPVVASSSITFQARSDSDDGLHIIELSDASSLGSGKPAASD